MKRLFLLLLLTSFAAVAQVRLSGTVRDAATRKPLPFASVSAAGGLFALSDVDGKFQLEASTALSNFTVSYVGFTSVTVQTAAGRGFYNVFLVPSANALSEVSVAPDHRALDLIRKTIAARSVNDPQKQLKTFDFKAYNKLIITANPDSLDGRIDSIYKGKDTNRHFSKIDSSDYKFKKVVAKQHLFQTEKVSQYQFANGMLKETVLGTKMAGFKRPIYEILGFNLQSFSIYDERYELFETLYRSPIAPESFQDYRFQLLDSTQIQGRKTYMVYFRNKKKSKAAGLEGVLYLDAQSAAVAKAVMRIRGVLDISGTHEFDYLPQQNLWFPASRDFRIVKGTNERNIRILGETLQFDTDNDLPGTNKRQKVASDFTYVQSQTQFSELQLNQPIQLRHAAIAIEVRDQAENQPESFWNRYRKDTLDVRSRKTYVALDSLVLAERIETRLLLGRKILNGYFPLGPVDLDLRYLLSYNNYEGFRVGLGGRTNEKFSRRFRLDGYTAYGIKDGTFKYSLGAAARLGKFSNSWVGGSYTDDVREIGSVSFATDKRIFKIYDPRPINVSTFYNHKTWRGYVETRIIPKTESIWQMQYSVVEPRFPYVYNLNDKLYERYTMTTAQLALQWNPFSDYMQTPYGRLEVEKRYPKFTFQLTQSLPKLLGNDFDFTKIDFRTEYEKKYLSGQKTNVLLQGGVALGEVPLTHLYNTAPNNLTKDRLLQRVTLSGQNAFETMFFYEFFSSRYAMLQLKHSVGSLKFSRKIAPELVLVTRGTFGTMINPERHAGPDYKTLEKGYYESGIELNRIYSAVGLVAFYRYGPYQLPRLEDNLAIKLSFTLNLGF